MNSLQITALVFLSMVVVVPALSALILTAAWILDRNTRQEPVMSPELRRLFWINTAHIVLCCIFGLVIGWILYRGWSADLPPWLQ